MNEKREESTESIRETYATPTYERFVFEASGLAMGSDPDPRPVSANGVVGFFYQDEEAVGVYSRN